MSSPNFPSPMTTEALQLELSLLQVLHHRNKNQHHLQPFFKHLSILKRTLSLLLDHPDSEFLLQKLCSVVIPQAWESFSRVVARGEFVALGMVLVAVVGRIAYCLGDVELGEDIEVEYTGLREENEELGVPVRRHIMDEESMVGDSEDHGDHENMAMELNPSPPEDMDVVPETERIQAHATLGMKGPEEETLGEIQEPPKKRRRKRRMDDIDILFAGLE
jgi:hypothetical protein